MYQRTHGRKFDTGDFKGNVASNSPFGQNQAKNIARFTRRPNYGLLLFRATLNRHKCDLFERIGFRLLD